MAINNNPENESLNFKKSDFQDVVNDSVRLEKAFAEFNASFRRQQFVGLGGGGLVKAVLFGNYRARSMYIDEEEMKQQDDNKQIDAYCVEAINNAIQALEETKDAQAEILARQLGLPLEQILARLQSGR